MSARPRPRRQLRSADESRAKILAAALGEFAERGYRGASLGAIATRAGLSQSGLLHHYPNKELLLAALIERRNDDHRAEYEAAVHDDPDLGFLTGMVRLMSRATREIELTRLFTVVVAEATSPDHPAHRWTVDRYDVVTALVADALGHARDRGLLRKDFDVHATASTLLAAMDGLQLRYLLNESPLPIDRAFANLVGRILGDLTADTPEAAAKLKAWRAGL
ncbi:TetR/AcrR family transcriptional regulator [Solirubrobacter taibaiensis]|nr:TetR/AcrR family transcriptional regulator [Solirubrobacter taibaiensis]